MEATNISPPELLSSSSPQLSELQKLNMILRALQGVPDYRGLHPDTAEAKYEIRYNVFILARVDVTNIVDTR